MWFLFGFCVVLVGAEYANPQSVGYREEYIRPLNNENLNDVSKVSSLANPYNSKIGWNEMWRTRIKKSLVSVDFHDGPKFQMHQLRSSGSPLVDWFYSAENFDREKPERRNPSFSPWGGKRSSSPYKSDSKIIRPARVPFNSWGGKRDSEHMDQSNSRRMTSDTKAIKKPFNSWGGKRTSPIRVEYLLNPSTDDEFKVKPEKYPPRSPEVQFDDYYGDDSSLEKQILSRLIHGKW